ncbi:MAG: hypothetical protein IPK26_22430 [Planctomycetes bacterium]|nr:hypothetical protein [Planctomycetota bacterium]
MSTTPPSSTDSRFAPQNDAGDARSRHPAGRFDFRFAVGDASVDVGSGTDWHGETSAILAGIRFEGIGGLVGGGVQFDFTTSDDDILRDDLPALTSTSTYGIDLFPHLTIRPKATGFRLPIRIGPHIYTRTLAFEGPGGDADVDFLAFGIGLELEPEFDLVRTNDMALSLYGQLRLGAGGALIETTNSIDTFTSDQTTVGGEFGLRWQAGGFSLSAGFMTQENSFDESDPEGSNIVEETDFGFTGVFLGAGFRW